MKNLQKKLKQEVGKEFYESADKTITVYRQETLEEAAERITYHEELSWENTLSKRCFIEGAEWQAERMYSKKEVMDMFDTFSMYLPLHYKFLLEEELKKE